VRFEERERKHVGSKEAKYAREAQHAVTASCTPESGSFELRSRTADAEVLAVIQSSHVKPVFSDLHRAFHADPEKRRHLLSHVAATSSFAE
jgi:hypothetical protein